MKDLRGVPRLADSQGPDESKALVAQATSTSTALEIINRRLGETKDEGEMTRLMELRETAISQADRELAMEVRRQQQNLQIQAEGLRQMGIQAQIEDFRRQREHARELELETQRQGWRSRNLALGARVLAGMSVLGVGTATIFSGQVLAGFFLVGAALVAFAPDTHEYFRDVFDTMNRQRKP